MSSIHALSASSLELTRRIRAAVLCADGEVDECAFEDMQQLSWLDSRMLDAVRHGEDSSGYESSLVQLIARIVARYGIYEAITKYGRESPAVARANLVNRYSDRLARCASKGYFYMTPVGGVPLTRDQMERELDTRPYRYVPPATDMHAYYLLDATLLRHLGRSFTCLPVVPDLAGTRLVMPSGMPIDLEHSDIYLEAESTGRTRNAIEQGLRVRLGELAFANDLE